MKQTLFKEVYITKIGPVGCLNRLSPEKKAKWSLLICVYKGQ